MFSKLADAPPPSPVPTPAITPNLAPGKKGPVGTAPRTNYSRVNTEPPISPDAGATQQKTLLPKIGAAMQKAAMMTGSSAVRPSIQDMIKSAMQGSMSRVKIAEEAKRQLGVSVDAEKVASATSSDSVSTELVQKLASACKYIAETMKKEAADLAGPYSLKENKVEPGKGPGALTVTETKDGKHTPDHMGQATSANVISKDPGMGNAGHKDPSNQMANDAHNPPGGSGHQQTALPGDKHAGALPPWLAKKEEKGEPKSEAKAEGETPKEEKKETPKEEKKEEKKASALYQGNLSFISKLAEDAINPAQISAGPASSTELHKTDASQSAGSLPGAAGLASTIEGAINYTKGQAKAEPKSDMKAYVDEPALSSAHDSVLQAAFSHTGEAGTKMSSANPENIKVAAAQALLQKLTEEVKG